MHFTSACVCKRRGENTLGHKRDKENNTIHFLTSSSMGLDNSSEGFFNPEEDGNRTKRSNIDICECTAFTLLKLHGEEKKKQIKNCKRKTMFEADICLNFRWHFPVISNKL